MTPKPGDFLKIARSGERFWAVYLGRGNYPTSLRLRCDNRTISPDLPRIGEEFTADLSEVVEHRRVIVRH